MKEEIKKLNDELKKREIINFSHDVLNQKIQEEVKQALNSLSQGQSLKNNSINHLHNRLSQRDNFQMPIGRNLSLQDSLRSAENS